MLVGTGSFSDPATLVGWGASLATRTTNGEWWRLLTMTFVHAGLFHLLVEVGALVSAGLVLERLLGPLAFGGVYVAAGTPRRARQRLGASAGPSRSAVQARSTVSMGSSPRRRSGDSCGGRP